MEGGGGNGGDTRPHKFPTGEPINTDYTKVPYLKSFIEENNKERNPKKRLGRGCPLYSEAIRKATRERKFGDAVSMVFEAIIDKVLPLKPCSNIAPLLHAMSAAGENAIGCQLFAGLMAHAGTSHAHDLYDDAMMTVGTRIMNANAAPTSDIRSILGSIPGSRLKRRLLHEVLDGASNRTDLDLVQHVLSLARENDVELWDCDYEKILVAIDKARAMGQWATSGWTSAVCALNDVLRAMELHHPIVGRRVATMIASLGKPGAEGCVDSETGECSSCGHRLQGFTLSDEEFQTLSEDIISKLVVPAMRRRSHYEKSDEEVSEEEAGKRKQMFDAFADSVKEKQFDVVIDGANVGYYGITNWYAKAKRDLLLRSGRPEDSITQKELTQMPLPVDVCPNFSAVNAVYDRVRALGYTPVIIFHERHLAPSGRLFGDNMTLLEKWIADGVVIKSPGFLNDDYCWLYACITKRSMIVSNDLMRDHHFQMLSRRSFVRWRQRHRITFRAGSGGASVFVPVSYSTWVQRAPSSSVWHVPFCEEAILDQATNKKKPAQALDKDGDDDCAGWLCVTV